MNTIIAVEERLYYVVSQDMTTILARLKANPDGFVKFSEADTEEPVYIRASAVKALRPASEMRWESGAEQPERHLTVVRDPG